MGKTISFVKGKGSITHNNRDFVADNVDRDRMAWNEYYVRQPIREAYEQIFGPAVEEYNAKQKRKDRQIVDYLTDIKNSGNKEKQFYEIVVQIGKKEDTGVLDDNGELSEGAKAAKEILGGTKEFTVSGLSEVETVDLFADVELEYTGIVGEYTYANVKLLSDDEILKACEFKIDRDCDFQNGDVITVTITNNEYLAENYQVVPAELSKAFTVSGLDAYLTDIADIDLLPEEQIREIIDQYVADSQKEDDFIFSYSESAYYKTYFCIGDKNTIGADRNRLMIYISYDKYMDGTYRETVYAPLIFHDLIMSANGTVVLDYENASKRTHGTDIDKMIETLERDYTVDEVYIEY